MAKYSFEFKRNVVQAYLKRCWFMDMLKEVLIVVLGVVGAELIMDAIHALHAKYKKHS